MRRPAEGRSSSVRHGRLNGLLVGRAGLGVGAMAADGAAAAAPTRP